ncbi:TetR/AcrR family transcriptional regulator [Corallococcus sp. EGB]|uniref:TetR/AcrR family transcriptional regulator n=1 Tax=Corallococcus sp. EGB TaxID=1521117 RepID=UPI001CBBC2B4|nr:TetR/AcrR family transcriptional regulator [Corallococcus sp. EGB]
MPRTGLSAEQLKEKAIDATLVRVRRDGHDKVRLSDVARDIGVSHAALYPHFADKAALFDAMLERWLRDSTESLAAVTRRSGDAQARIVDWFVTLYRMKRSRALDDPAPFRAFDVASAVEKPFAIAHVKDLLGQLQELLAEAGVKDAREKADLLFRATAAFHHPTLVTQSAHDDLEPQLRAIVRLMLRGMTSK